MTADVFSTTLPAAVGEVTDASAAGSPARQRRRGVSHDPRVEVRRGCSGLGLFARQPFARGERVAEYVGRRMDQAAYLQCRSAYVFDLGDGLYIDGAPRWNLARYINHSCVPNCEAVVEGDRVFIEALRDISPGEELAYDYGREYFEDRLAGRCRCPKCAAGA
jgi:uncharacterized protein